MSKRTRFAAADLQRLARHRDRLARRGAGDIELGDLGVVDRDCQLVAVFGKLGAAVVTTPVRRAPAPWPCGAASRCRCGEPAASRRRPSSSCCLRPNPGVCQADQRGRFGGAADRPGTFALNPSTFGAGRPGAVASVFARGARMPMHLVGQRSRDRGWRTSAPGKPAPGRRARCERGSSCWPPRKRPRGAC